MTVNSFSYISPAVDVDPMRDLVLWGAQEWRQRMAAMRWERAGGVNKNNFEHHLPLP